MPWSMKDARAANRVSVPAVGDAGDAGDAETPADPLSQSPDDQPSSPGDASPPARDRRFPCSQCGATLHYAPGTHRLACAFCGAENSIVSESRNVVQELDYQSHLDALVSTRASDEVHTVACDACGAEYQYGGDRAAGLCPYCGSAAVGDMGVSQRMRPGGVLPFHIDDRTARAAILKWRRGLWWAPSDFAAAARLSAELDGVYLPFWTYDADTDSRYVGERGTAYTTWETVTVRRNGETRRERRAVRRIRWTSASGRVNRFFDDVLVPAGSSLSAKSLEALEPWDLGGLQPYKPEYIAGYTAETYAIDLADGFTRARAVMDRVIRVDVARDIGGDAQRIHNVYTAYSDVTFKYVLLPVWISAYRYGSQVYRVMVNARTGQVTGERPWSWMKIALTVIPVLLIVVAMAFFGANFADAPTR